MTLYRFTVSYEDTIEAPDRDTQPERGRKRKSNTATSRP